MMMDQETRLDFLLTCLCGEREESIPIPDTYTQKRSLLRALMNVRPPKPVIRAFLSVQDVFLQEEALERGVVCLQDIPPSHADARISVWQGDITRLRVDAIVNAANATLLGCFIPGHHCIDNAIHTYAGMQLREACNELMKKQAHEELTGTVKITSGYNLPCRYILHTVGPMVQGEPTAEQKEALASCYHACLNAAMERGLESIALCCISTGVFGFPQREAAHIAIQTVKKFLLMDGKIKRAIFDVFQNCDLDLYTELLN